MDNNSRRAAYEKGILSLWLNWTIPTGAFTLLTFISIWVSKMWIPFVALGLGIALWADLMRARGTQRSHCMLTTWLAVRVLLISALIMLGINTLSVKGILDEIYTAELVNPKNPYITVLVVATTALVVAIWAMIRGEHTSFNQESLLTHGQVEERGFIGKVMNDESRFTVKMLLFVSFSISLISWVYYFTLYINVNMNTPDKFVFNWVPTILWAASVLYMGARYFSIWGYYYQDRQGTEHRQGSATLVRFLIFHDETIYLFEPDQLADDPLAGKIDTPASIFLTFREQINTQRANEIFSNLTAIPEDDYSLRFMYSSTDATGSSNMFHYIVSVKDPHTIGQSSLPGDWFTMSRLHTMVESRQVAPILRAELYRLYTVTMAWKTYNRDGSRIYKIKDYRPAFRVKGINDWDVDFNDTQWLHVARHNEDKPFFRLRSIWRRLFN